MGCRVTSLQPLSLRMLIATGKFTVYAYRSKQINVEDMPFLTVHLAWFSVTCNFPFQFSIYVQYSFSCLTYLIFVFCTPPALPFLFSLLCQPFLWLHRIVPFCLPSFSLIFPFCCAPLTISTFILNRILILLLCFFTLAPSFLEPPP